MLESKCQCPLVIHCRSCCTILPFTVVLIVTKTFRECTQLSGVLNILFLLSCPSSSEGPEMVGVSFCGN